MPFAKRKVGRFQITNPALLRLTNCVAITTAAHCTKRIVGFFVTTIVAAIWTGGLLPKDWFDYEALIGSLGGAVTAGGVQDAMLLLLQWVTSPGGGTAKILGVVSCSCLGGVIGFFVWFCWLLIVLSLPWPHVSQDDKGESTGRST